MDSQAPGVGRRDREASGSGVGREGHRLEQRDQRAQGDVAEEAAARSATTGLPVLSPAALAARQETFKGFGDGLALAFELALTPLIFGLIGYGLDRWLGLLPVLTVVLVLLCIVGLSMRMWFEYDAQMKVHEAAGPWARRPVTTAAVLEDAPAEERR